MDNLKLPPSLLYLVIYNPTLSSLPSADPDDEDAEEQAHVLFYTGNDHAVSKDRVLRQVGLAKALANFTTIFVPQASCDSIHSQSRRMIMLTPEPDFWIHACFELEKSSRMSRKEEKGKSKQKEPTYDHNEASLHDISLQTQLSLGYETFKVTHGSFTSILRNRGREALELQLERFFTVWAWRWDLRKQPSFTSYLGIRVHPLSNQLMPLIDVLEDRLPSHYYPIVLVSSCIIASKSIPLQCPPGLIRHLLRILESRTAAQQITRPESDVRQADPAAPMGSVNVNDSKHTRSASKAFLGMPGLNMNVNMDVRKWNWPGYLTLGIGGTRPNSGSHAAISGGNTAEGPALDPAQQDGEEHKANRPHDVQVKSDTSIDSQALEDALSSEADAQSTISRINDTALAETLHEASHEPEERESFGSNSVSPLHNPLPDLGVEEKAYREDATLENDTAQVLDQTLPGVAPSHSFSEIHVHLSDSDPLDTQRRTVRYLCIDNILMAIVPMPEREDETIDEETSQDLAHRSIELIDRLKDIVKVEEEKIASAFSSSPVQTVLQRSQNVIITPNQLTYSSPSFSAASWHLHEGRRALRLNPEVLEIYSRGQNPQDWHLVKRGLGNNGQGEVYMEIGRKEASLVDIDNEITGVLRRFAEYNHCM